MQQSRGHECYELEAWITFAGMMGLFCAATPIRILSVY